MCFHDISSDQGSTNASPIRWRLGAEYLDVGRSVFMPY